MPAIQTKDYLAYRNNAVTNTKILVKAGPTDIRGVTVYNPGASAAALTLSQANQVRISEHATSGMDPDAPFSIVQKNGANSDLVYRYTTTNAPTSGVIQFFLDWEPLSADAAVTNQ